MASCTYSNGRLSFCLYLILGTLHLAAGGLGFWAVFLPGGWGSDGFRPVLGVMSGACCLVGIGLLLRQPLAALLALAVYSLVLIGLLVELPGKILEESVSPAYGKDYLWPPLAFAFLVWLVGVMIFSKWTYRLLALLVPLVLCLASFAAGRRLVVASDRELRPVAERIMSAWFDPAVEARIYGALHHGVISFSRVWIELETGCWYLGVSKLPGGRWEFAPQVGMSFDPSPRRMNEPSMSASWVREFIRAAGLNSEIAQTAVYPESQYSPIGVARLPGHPGDVKVWGDGRIYIELGGSEVP